MKPIYSHGFFHVCEAGTLIQEIIFQYLDKDMVFWNALQGGGVEEEINKLKENMQGFLEEERILINGKKSEPEVLAVFPGFLGSRRRPYVRYVIMYPAHFRKGINTYIDEYEPVMSDYPYGVIWVFPKGTELLEVEMGVPYEVRPPNVLHFRVKRKVYLPGRERIVFYLP